MISAVAVLAYSTADRINLIPEGDQLCIVGDFSDEFVSAIRQHKPEILAQLYGIPLEELRHIAGAESVFRHKALLNKCFIEKGTLLSVQNLS